MDSMATTAESDDEDTPKPLRSKTPQNQASMQSRIPQRSSSFYFARSANVTSQQSVNSSSNLTPLIPSPVHSPALIVNKSRRSDTTSNSSYETILSTRPRVQRSPCCIPKENRLAASTLTNLWDHTDAYELDDGQNGSRAPLVDSSPLAQCISIHTAKAFLTQPGKPTWSDDIDYPGYDEPSCEKQTRGRISRLSSYKRKFLHTVGLGYCTISTSKEDSSNRSNLVDRSFEADNGCAEQDFGSNRKLSTETQGTTESAIASFLDYPSPLSTPTRSSFASRTTATSINSIPRTSSLPSARQHIYPILVAKLSLTPELDVVIADRENSMFVAVDIEAALEQVRPTNPGAPGSTLDLAVVIDNSSLTSVASLMTSCEAVYYLSSYLGSPQDRLAVLITNSHDGVGETRVVLPLGPIVTRRVREVIDAIAISTSKLDFPPTDAIDKAVQLLTTLGPENANKEDCHRSLRHVIVFTPDSAVVSSLNHGYDSIGVHFVNPGLIPWNMSATPVSRGWIISNDLSLPFSEVDSDHDLHGKLKDMLIDLRRHTDYGRLTNISVKVEPGYKCLSQGIMGETTFLELFPGETRTFLVKVQIDLLPDQSSRLLQFPSGSRTTSGSINLEKELENIIGNDCRTILSVTVQYENSLLPAGTVCTYRTDARLPKYTCRTGVSGQFPTSEGTLTVVAPIRSGTVQKRLISHLASHQHPRQALITLENAFGPLSNPASCAPYLDSVVKELKHQACLHEHFNNLNDGCATANLRDDKIQNKADQGRPLGNPVIPTRCASSHQTGTVVHRPLIRPKGCVPSPTSDENVDMARKIWLELRRNSRSVPHRELSPRLPDERNIKSNNFPNHEWKRIQSIALSNKRSLGQDTMRSLSYNGAGTRASAPWL